MQRNDYGDNYQNAQSDSYRQNTQSSDRGQYQSVSSLGLPKPIPARRDDRSMSPMNYHQQYETFIDSKNFEPELRLYTANISVSVTTTKIYEFPM